MCISIKNHQNNLFFSYDKLGCRSFELNLFSHFFNLKDLNLNKHIERLRKDLLFALRLTDLTKCPKCMLFTLRDQIITTSKALHSKRTRIVRFVEIWGEIRQKLFRIIENIDSRD